MKKTLFLCCGIILLISSCSGSSKQTVFTLNDQEVVVKICINTTKAELTDIETRLKAEKNIDFTFDKTTFSSNGNIDVLDFVVKGPEGYQGHVQAELYMTDEYHGFKRDYRKNTKKNFQCGALD